MKRKKVDDKGKQSSSFNGKTSLTHVYLTGSTIARRLGMKPITLCWYTKRFTTEIPLYSIPSPHNHRTWATNERLVLAWEAERARRQAARAAAKQQRQGDRVK